MLQNIVCKRDCRADARCILEHIERTVEVRNAHPLDRDIVVRHDVRVICFVQFTIHLGQALDRQRLARLRHAMCFQLKLRKHRLAIAGRAELLAELVQQIRALHAVCLLAEQMPHHKHLVDGGSNLRNHGLVLRHLIGQSGVGMIGVHGMAKLVCKCERVVYVVLVIQQHKGMHTVDAPRKRSRGLSLVLVYVNPAVVVRFVQQACVVFAERRKRFLDGLFRFLIAHGHSAIRYDGRIKIIHFKLIDAKLLFAQRHIAAHSRQLFMHGLNELLIHGDGNVVAKERRFERALVAARPCAEHVALDRACIGGADGVLHACICRIQLFIGFFAHTAVRAVEQRSVGAVGELDLLALFIRHGAEIEIDVRKHRENVVRTAERVLCHGKDTLFARRKHMLALSVHIGQHETEWCEALLRRPRLQRLRGNGQDLRHKVCRLRFCGNDQLHGAVGQALIERVAVVLVSAHVGINKQALHAVRYRTLRFQRLIEHVRRFCQLALIGRKKLDLLLRLLKFFFPKFVCFKDVRQLPLERRIGRSTGLMHHISSVGFLFFPVYHIVSLQSTNQRGSSKKRSASRCPI